MTLLIRLAAVLILLVLTVIALGFYKFNIAGDDLYIKENDMVRPLAPFEEGARSVMMRLFSLDTGHSFKITLPDSNSAVTLTGFNKEPSLAVGAYQDKEIRGEVLLDYLRLTPLNLPGNTGTTQFAAPFAVTTQGTGVFWYLGMFRLDDRSGSITHLDSQYLGDRVVIQAISPDIPFDPPHRITISLRTLAPEQPMATTPGQETERTFYVTRDTIEVSASR
ncbi:hypothetical protein [Oceanimonas baumannii]|uniref:Uncharacterized protein n=1 Tax=Oceanimonas baumannii TaxID=129578 RepID=A0A235CC79_9GAMM|nr:hypothetical protein [Oceanimonas baumannii]OYD21415.1 hypothetical protein B6S09_15950 [Oceanimonas baumannii]TDW56362.1 hypothetical protein LY04_02984 [Oceanimonas baumannii]